MSKDDAKRHYYSGNRHNAACDILLTEARIESLEMESPSCVHEKRYVKHQNEYWERDIVEQRRAKRLCTSEHVDQSSFHGSHSSSS